MSSGEDELKEKRVRIQIDRSEEIKHLEEENAQYEVALREKQELLEQRETALKIIAEKEFGLHRKALELKGVDTLAIDQTTDPEERVKILKDLELQLQLNERGHAPRGGESPTFEQIKNEPSKRQRAINEAVNQALIDNGMHIESIDFSSLDEMKDTLRKIALDTTDPRNAKAREILNQWTEKGVKHPFEIEYQGKLSELGKSRPKKGEWKEVNKGEKA
jgi:hypothetical protein